MLQEFIMLADAFSRFWGPTFASDNFEMIDSVGNTHEITIVRGFLHMRYIRKGIPEFVKYYEIKNDHVMRLTYMGDYKFLVRIFDLAGDEITYINKSTDSCSTTMESNDENPFYFSTKKTLTQNDIRSSSLVSFIASELILLYEFIKLLDIFSISFTVLGCTIC